MPLCRNLLPRLPGPQARLRAGLQLTYNQVNTEIADEPPQRSISGKVTGRVAGPYFFPRPKVSGGLTRNFESASPRF